MPCRRQRSATIADMMICVIGTAIAFASWRFIMSMRIWNNFPDSLQFPVIVNVVLVDLCYDIPAGATVMALSLLGGDLVLLVADRHRLRLALAALICPAAE